MSWRTRKNRVGVKDFSSVFNVWFTLKEYRGKKAVLYIFLKCVSLVSRGRKNK